MTLRPDESRFAPESAPGVCPDCSGPSQRWKGHVHAWRCSACCRAMVGLDRLQKVSST